MIIVIVISSCLLILFLYGFLNEYITESVEIFKKLRGHFNRKYFGKYFKNDLYEYIAVIILVLSLIYMIGYIITITTMLLRGA